MTLNFSGPGKPVDDCLVESFRQKCCDEIRSLHWLLPLAGAREGIEAWRIDYNTERPHRTLGGHAPSEYAALLHEYAQRLRSSHS